MKIIFNVTFWTKVTKVESIKNNYIMKMNAFTALTHDFHFQVPFNRSRSSHSFHFEPHTNKVDTEISLPLKKCDFKQFYGFDQSILVY